MRGTVFERHIQPMREVLSRTGETNVRPHGGYFIIACILCGLLPAAGDGLAAQAGGLPDSVQIRRITLEEALARMAGNNLSLRIARAEVAAARGRLTTAGVIANPGLSATREQLSGGGAGYHETSIVLSQALEIGGKRGLRRTAAEISLEAAAARLAAEQVRLTFDVRRAFVAAAAAEARMSALEQTTAVFRQVEQSGQARFREGDISEFALQRLQVERARYENLAAEARLAVRLAGGALALLVMPDSGGFLLLPAVALDNQSATPSAAALDAVLSAAAARPDVVAASLEVEAAQARLNLQRRERTPDITLSAGYKDQADGFRGAIVGVSVPLPFLNRNAGRIEEATAELSGAEARRVMALREAEAQIREAWETYRSLTARMALLNDELLTNPSRLLATAKVAYAEGEMSLVELLDAADAFRAARETTIDLTSQRLTALYHLELVLGRLNASLPLALEDNQ